MRFWRLYLLIFAFGVFSCTNDDNDNLPPVEERVTEAIASLKSELVAPTEGWRLEYQPSPDAGIFFMLLYFDENGNVNIRSDVADNNGEFLEQTITYRIDNALGLELIFETYGVFHYLFELNQSTFGGEFEFLYKEKEGENLRFESISDPGTPTQIVFEPAQPGDENLFSGELAENLEAFVVDGPNALVVELPSQQIVLEDLDISIFWTIDVASRNLRAEVAGSGSTVPEVLSNGVLPLNHFTGYRLSNGRMILEDPLEFRFSGFNINIEQLALTDFSMTGPSLCQTGVDTTPRYAGQIPGLGSITMLSSLLTTRGAGFQPDVYQINPEFIFDNEGNSLLEDGVIGDIFPDAVGFIQFYGVQLNDPDIPINSAGLLFVENDSLVIHVREYEPTDTEINRVLLRFNDNYYYSVEGSAGNDTGLATVTDEIFQGGEVYAFDFTQEDVYRLYNPCNGYEIFLVGN